MNAVERRIRTIRLAEMIEKNPEIAEELGIRVVSYIKEDESDSKEKES